MTKKLLFFGIWLVSILIGLYAVKSNINLNLVIGSRSALSNLSQRVFGILVYILMFWQIILGANMQWWTEKFGGWIFKFHILDGVFVYLLILIHTFSFILFKYFLYHRFDPIFIYFDICVLCKTALDYFYTIGRINFWLLTITVFAGIFRAATPFMRTNWRKFHVLNYLVFLLTGVHAYFLGTDFSSKPFFYFAVFAYAVVLYIVIFKKLPELVREFLVWVKN